MKDWQDWLKDMVTLAMWLTAASAVVWKAFDAWEKKTSAPVKDIKGRVEKLEDCCKKHDEEVKGIKENAKQLLGLFIDQLKK